jgi:biotin carboxyl carrier protein
MRWIVKGTTATREVEVEREGDHFAVTVDGVRRIVDYIPLDRTIASLRYLNNGHSFHVTAHREGKRSFRVAVGEREFTWDVLTPVEAVASETRGASSGASQITAPIPGKVVKVNVVPGDDVVEGQSVVVLEAMKMENELETERAGRVASVLVSAGDTVATGTVLVELDVEDHG